MAINLVNKQTNKGRACISTRSILVWEHLHKERCSWFKLVQAESRIWTVKERFIHTGCFVFRAVSIMSQLKCETFCCSIHSHKHFYSSQNVIAYEILTPWESLETTEGHYNAINKNYLMYFLKIVRRDKPKMWISSCYLFRAMYMLTQSWENKVQ